MRLRSAAAELRLTRLLGSVSFFAPIALVRERCPQPLHNTERTHAIK